MLPLAIGNVAVLVIVVIYYTWRDVVETRARRERLRKERVAKMLWAMAQRTD